MIIAAILSSLIFIICLVLIFTEKINRTIVGIAGAVLMVGVGKLFGFYSETQALAAMDFNTLGLLLGMMILVALLEPTGIFQYLAIWAARLSKGRPVYLLVLLVAVTTIISMFLDNVTTIVLIAPVTILICEILGIKAAPFLISEALLSNIGGVATLIGDPPNIIIGSAAGLTFMDFLTYSLPIVIIVWVFVIGLLCFLFRHDLAVKPKKMKAIMRLEPSDALDDRKSASKVLIVLGVAILFFFVSGLLDISPSFVALSSAGMALVLIRPDISKTLVRIEWSVVLFFTALFVLVGGLKAAGVLEIFVHLVENAKAIPPVFLGVIIIWVVAGLSTVVDNIPVTIAMIPVIQGLGAAGMSIGPFCWALVFGAGFGGNGTIIGSTAGTVVATLSEKTHSPITPRLWNKRGLPVMFASCILVTLLYVLAFPLFPK